MPIAIRRLPAKRRGKYSPGPWHYFEQRTWGAFASTYGCVGNSKPGTPGFFVIVNGCAPGGTEEAKANAKLMSAAPNLLEACHAVVESWESGDLAGAARLCQAAIDEAIGD
jgi:hypothetical protein